mmetsp:Transcript_21911/g.68653  ORF Transcript_21911/g.68653 Transcript_21911/m.68653 type:complete len:231 (-) Transcript_21911:70-762(-)
MPTDTRAARSRRSSASSSGPMGVRMHKAAATCSGRAAARAQKARRACDRSLSKAMPMRATAREKREPAATRVTALGPRLPHPSAAAARTHAPQDARHVFSMKLAFFSHSPPAAQLGQAASWSAQSALAAKGDAGANQQPAHAARKHSIWRRLVSFASRGWGVSPARLLHIHPRLPRTESSTQPARAAAASACSGKKDHDANESAVHRQSHSLLSDALGGSSCRQAMARRT